MDGPPPYPYQPPSSLGLTLAKPRDKGKNKAKTTRMTASRSGSRSCSHSRSRSASPSKRTVRSSLRSRFLSTRRSNQHRPASSISSVSSAEIGKAKVVEFFRTPEKAKVVQGNSPRTVEKGSPSVKAGKQNRKLLEYYGVRQQDREVVVRQRAGRRHSIFREEFSPPRGVEMQGPVGLHLHQPPRPRDQGVVSESQHLNEGLRKWFRCDIYPASTKDFHAAEGEAKRLVIEMGGTIMKEWAYPGGFMFQIPYNVEAPLPTTPPSPLDSLLGEGGSVRVTEFQPYLEPMQHLLQLATTPSSTTTEADPDELVSAAEYIRSSDSMLPSSSIEEVPFLRSPPEKTQKQCSRGTVGPETKGRLQDWLAKQKCLSTRKKGRGRAVHGLPEHFGWNVGHRCETVVEEDEDNEEDAEGEWVSEDEEVGSNDGSQVSIATGLESVRFVAECGALL